MIDDIRKLYKDKIPFQATERKSAIQRFRPYKAIVIPYDVEPETNNFTKASKHERQKNLIRVTIPELNYLVVSARLINADSNQNESQHHTDLAIGQYVIAIPYTDEYWIALKAEEHAIANNIPIDENITVTDKAIEQKPSLIDHKSVSWQYVYTKDTNQIDRLIQYNVPQQFEKQTYTRKDFNEGYLTPYERYTRNITNSKSLRFNYTIESIDTSKYDKEPIVEYKLATEYVYPVYAHNSQDYPLYTLTFGLTNQLLQEPRDSEYRKAYTERLDRQFAKFVVPTHYRNAYLLHDTIRLPVLWQTTDNGIQIAYVAHKHQITIYPTKLTSKALQTTTIANTKDLIQSVVNQYPLPKYTRVMSQTNIIDKQQSISFSQTLGAQIQKPLQQIYPDVQCQPVSLDTQVFRRITNIEGSNSKREHLVYQYQWHQTYNIGEDPVCNKTAGCQEVLLTMLHRVYENDEKMLQHNGIEHYSRSLVKVETGAIPGYYAWSETFAYSGFFVEHPKTCSDKAGQWGILAFGHQLHEGTSTEYTTGTNRWLAQTNLDRWLPQQREGSIYLEQRSQNGITIDNTYYQATTSYWWWYTLWLYQAGDKFKYKYAEQWLVEGSLFLQGIKLISDGGKYRTVESGEPYKYIVDVTDMNESDPKHTRLNLIAGTLATIHVYRHSTDDETQIILTDKTIIIVAKNGSAGKTLSVELDSSRQTIQLATEDGSIVIDPSHISIAHKQAIDIQAPIVRIGPTIAARTVLADTVHASIPGCNCGSPSGDSPNATTAAPSTPRPSEGKDIQYHVTKFAINPEEA